MISKLNQCKHHFLKNDSDCTYQYSHIMIWAHSRTLPFDWATGSTLPPTTCCVNYLYSQWSVGAWGACHWHGWMMPWPDCPPLYLAICGRLIRRWSKGEVLTRPNLCYKWYYCSIFTSSFLELHNYINMHFHYFLYRPFAISYILLQYWKDCWGINTMLQSCHYHLNRSQCKMARLKGKI